MVTKVGTPLLDSAILEGLAGLSLTEGDILFVNGDGELTPLAKGTAGQVLAVNGGATAPQWVTPASSILKDVKFITSTSTWTKPAGFICAYVVAIAGGGGGGYAKPSSSQAAVGGGGGGGGRREGFFTDADLGGTVSVTIGTGGAGGVASTSTAAGAGVDTTFGAHLTAKGGEPGGSSSSTTTTGGSAGGGAVSAAGSGGDIGVRGASGGRGVIFSGSICISGKGADALYGMGGADVGADNSGASAIGYGAGGGGAASTNSADRNGGAGAPGLVIVYEFTGS